MKNAYDKQLVIKNISELEVFIDKLVAKIEAIEESCTEIALISMCSMVDRKEEELLKWREILKTL